MTRKFNSENLCFLERKDVKAQSFFFLNTENTEETKSFYIDHRSHRLKGFFAYASD